MQMKWEVAPHPVRTGLFGVRTTEEGRWLEDSSGQACAWTDRMEADRSCRDLNSRR